MDGDSHGPVIGALGRASRAVEDFWNHSTFNLPYALIKLKHVMYCRARPPLSRLRCALFLRPGSLSLPIDSPPHNRVVRVSLFLRVLN